MNPPSIHGSALTLMQLAQSNMKDAVNALGQGNPDAMVDGLMALQTAKTSQAIAIKMSEVSRQMDEASLDLLA